MLSLLGLLLALGVLYYFIFTRTEATILQSAERLRDQAGREVEGRVTTYLNEAPMAVTHFENEIHHGLINPGDASSLRNGLLSLLLSNENISEASFTYARSTGYDADGGIQVEKSSAGEITVFRKDGKLTARRTWFERGQFITTTSDLDSNLPSPLSGAPGMDPTEHATFQTPARKNFDGQLLWTDLHWSQLDDALPENQRQLEVSVQKTVKNTHDEFAGVLRVGLMKDEINRAVQLPGAAEGDPTLIFLCVREGHLITGFGPDSRVTDFDGDLRISADNAPPQVQAALQLPGLKNVEATPGHSLYADTFRSGGKEYVCTFRALPETQAWITGIVVPRDFYLGALLKMRNQLLWISLLLIAVIIKVGVAVLHSIGRAHALIVRESSRMNAFEFSPSENSSRLRDICEVLSSLEKTKTAMRAMGKYVPVDLVRRLYQGGKEPVLGGESVDLSVLFTDIRGFTSFAEGNEPGRVAEILGRYLQAMVGAIQSERGTIDKFIGDSVMAFWNAPADVADHPLPACAAALKCRDALRALYASPEWDGAPAFETRFGLHRCEALVGHYGAPDRFNYTAIGDGINLASRLEGLNNHYGTDIIASETVYEAAKEKFAFRLLDRVAVKGRTGGVTIYELLAEKNAGYECPPAVKNYENAFGEFQKRNFNSALLLLETFPNDPPSAALATRCHGAIENPPDANWSGLHIFETK